MPEQEPTFENSKPASITTTLEHEAPVTDEELNGLDPSVLSEMGKIDSVLSGEKTVDDVFGVEGAYDIDTPAEEKSDTGDINVAASNPIPTTTPTATIPSAQPVNSPTSVPSAPTIPSVSSLPTPVSDVPVFVVGSVDDSRGQYERAHEAGIERLTAELNDGGRWRRFLNGIWKGNQARQYYEAKYTQEALGQAGKVNDVTRLAMIDRLTSEADETVHTEAGERRYELAGDSEFATRTKELVRSYIEDGLSEDVLVEERGRMLQELAESGNKDLLGEGRLRLDNIIEIAQAVKGATEQGASLERVLDGMKFVTAEAQTGARTEVHYNAVERAANKLASTRIGALVGPMTVITALGILTTATKIGSHSVVGAAVKTVAPGAAGAIWAGMRENRHVKDERAQHAREMAYGGVVEDGSKRRAEMEATRYETATARQLTEDLRSLIGEGVDLSQQSAVEAALASLSAVEARMQMGDHERRDLISYSSREDVETERLDLDLARAEVRRALEIHMTDDVRAQLGVEAGQSLHEVIAERGRRTAEVLAEDVSAKDRAFNHLRTRRIAKAAATGLIVGMAAGAIAQEITAAVDPMRAGLIEQLWHAKTGISANGEHQTLLEGMVHGEHSTVHHIASTSMGPEQHIGTNGTLSASSDETVVHNPNGTISFVDPNGHEVVSNLPVGPDGQLTPADIQELQNHGFVVNDLSHSVTEVQTSTTTQNLSAEDFVHQNGDLTTHIQRDFWYDNNTSGVYDHNELGLHWGGSGVNPDGSYQMSIATMTADGSSHGSLSTNWAQDASAGKLELAISATKGTQTEVFMVPISPDGSIHIAADSPAAHFFSNDNGHAVFNGKYAEVVQNIKTDDNGIEHVRPLATLVGHNNVGTIQETVTTQTPVEHMQYNYNIVSPGYDTIQQNFTEMAPNIPIVSRTPLERLKMYRQTGENMYGYYGASGEWKERMRERWRVERSPRLKRNPDADLNTGEELKWYRDKESKRRGEAYIKELDGYIGASEVLKQVDANTKAIVCIPVAAANESENIYRTLSLFARQEDQDAVSKTVILLNVNWKQSLEGDTESKVKIDQTIAEIERARADFPQLKIASFEKVWSDEFVGKKNGKIYGEVIKVLYDTAAMAINQAVVEGRRSADDETMLITNDADTLGMSRNYLRQYIRALEENPKQDAFTGVIRRGTESYGEYPGYGVVSAFYATMVQSMLRHQVQTGGGFTTDGPNSGMRMSMYAAMGGVEEGIGASADALLAERMGVVRRSPRDRTLLERLRRVDGVPHGSQRVMGRLVGGAQIDTLPDRLLGAYKEGKWIAEGWNGFDNGGYESREDVMARGTLGPENPAADIDSIAERIEISINGFANNWWKDSPGALDSSVVLTFGDRSHYTFSRENGTYKFKFTDEGKKWLKNRLTRDTHGRFDPYGSRLQRQVYGHVKAGAKRTLVQSEPRMLS